MTPVKSAPGLVRALGPLMAMAIVVGTVIGSGIFKKPQAVAEYVPWSGLAALVWIAGGLLTLLGALTYAEVLAMFPRAGGNYVFLREGYGRIFGFLWGWVDFGIIRTAAMAALATVFTESLNDVLRNDAFQDAFGIARGTELNFWPQKLLTVAILMTLTVVNIRGVTWGGGLQVIVTAVKIGTLLAIIVLPFVLFGMSKSADVAASPAFANLEPMWPTDWSDVKMTGITGALLGVLFAYHGWGNLAPVAEEVRNPGRNLPLAMLGGVGLVLVLYLGANLAYNLVMPQSEMAGLKDTTVATQFSLRLLGPLGGAATSAAVMISAFGALNGNLLAGPRLLYAMGKDGIIPSAFGTVHPRYHTPALSILVVGAMSAALILAVSTLTWFGKLDPAKSHFDLLTNYAMFGSMTFETMGVMSIFVFRWKFPDMERPYRCWGYPVVPALYIVLPAFILWNMFIGQPVEALSGLGFIAIGVIVYWLVVKRESSAINPKTDG